MIQQQQKTIGEHTYRVTQFPAMQGLKIQFRLMKILGPLFNGLMAAQNGSLNLMEMFSGTNLTEKELLDLIKDLLSQTQIDGHKIQETDINNVFAGDYYSLYELLFFVIEVNYKDFFEKGGIGSLLNQLLPILIGTDTAET